MPTMRKNDKYITAFLTLISAGIICIVTILWSLPDTYAKKVDVEKVEKSQKEARDKIDDKLDEILKAVNTISTNQAVIQTQVVNITQKVDKIEARTD